MRRCCCQLEHVLWSNAQFLSDSELWVKGSTLDVEDIKISQLQAFKGKDIKAQIVAQGQTAWWWQS